MIMKKKNMRLICFILIIYSLFSCFGAIAYAEETLPESMEVLSDNVEVGSRFLELFFGEKDKKGENVSLLPGGGVFGVKIKQEYLTVTDAKGIPAL